MKLMLGTALMGATLVTGTAAGAFAHGGGGRGGAGGGGLTAYGTLRSISANSITVATPSNGAITATLAATTTYTARSQAAALAGLKTGNSVAVRGSSVNGTNTVRSVEFDTAAFAAAAVRYTGTIASLSGNTLVITLSGGQSVTVTLNSNTKYAVNGAAASTRPALTPGLAVRVSAAIYTNGSAIAQVVSLTQ